jgi:phospholipid-binding lipoprotein MlaA
LKPAQLLDSDGLLRQSSDPYIMVREAYFQNHDFIANGGKLKPEENPNAKAIENELKDIDSKKKGEQCSPFLILRD